MLYFKVQTNIPIDKKYYINTMFACVYACVLVAYLLQNGWTNLAKPFLLALSWSQDGFRPKNSGSRIQFFRKSGKTVVYYLTNLSENHYMCCGKASSSLIS